LSNVDYVRTERSGWCGGRSSSCTVQ